MGIVEQLREEELQAIRSAKDNGNPGHALKQLRERGKAQDLIRQQYSGRYPFELLQNANDAAKESGIEEGRSAHFLLTDTALLVADNGLGFGEKQIRAICSLGESSKGPGQAIGHKGLGFMSTGEIAEGPQIISTSAEFEFNGKRIRRDVEQILGSVPEDQLFPAYAFPYPLADEDLGEDAAVVRRFRAEGWSTVIRLPLGEMVSRTTVEHDLQKNLFPHLLLFLPSIQMIQLEGTSADFTAMVERKPAGNAWKTTLLYGDEIEEWLIYRHQFAPEPELLEPLGKGWEDLETIQMAIGVPLDEEGEPKVGSEHPLSVYFPTEESAGLRVAIHAEWLLTLDRKHVSDAPEAKPLNNRIFEELARFVAETYAEDLVGRFNFSRPAVHSLMPRVDAVVSLGAGFHLKSVWTNSLANAKFIPTAGGSLRAPTELRMLPDWVPDAEVAQRFINVDPETLLRPDLATVPAVRQLIKGLVPNAELTANELVGHLRHVEHDELASYYQFLIACRDAARVSFSSALANASSVLTSQGQWTSPGRTPVFLPRGRGETSIPDGIPVPIAEIAEDVPDLEKFLESLGVKPFQWAPIIENYIIAVLRDPNAADGLRDQALASLKAYNKQRRGDAVPARLVEILSDVLLPARNVDGSERELRRGGDLYFPSSWTTSSDLEVLYGPFGEVEFLDILPPDGEDEKTEAFSFYSMLGVYSYPFLDEETTQYSGWSHPHTKDPLFSRWWGLESTQELATGCQMGHPQSQLLSRSYTLDRLDEILDSKDPDRLTTLWRQLALNWNVFAAAMRSEFHCKAAGYHPAPRNRTTESIVAYTLRSRAWIPVQRGDESQLAVPNEAWYEAPETPRAIRAHLPLASNDLLHVPGGAALASFLGLTDVARPEIPDLLTLLDRLAADADAAEEVPSDIALAARWIQRRINDHLHRDPVPHPEPKAVRLLATENGVKQFTVQPAYATDRLLRETWEKREPVLFGESQLGRLAKYLGLADLDDEVDTIPEAIVGPYDHESEATEWVRSRIDARKPYVLALVSVENPGSAERTERRLKFLDIVVCEELGLRYRRGDAEIPRPSAPCFIKGERQRMGSTSRVVGTAYLRLRPQQGQRLPQPDWHAFSSQLAEFLEVPTLADAIAMIYTTSDSNRASMLAQHSVEPSDVASARERLNLPEEPSEELVETIEQILPLSPNLELTNVAPVSTPPGIVVAAPLTNQNLAIPDPELEPVAGPTAVTTTIIPLVDVTKVKMVDAKPGAIVTAKSLMATPSTYSSGGTSSAPGPAETQRNQDVGKHGERIAFEKERERLIESGLDPKLAIWVSKDNELAPFDIQSVDDSQTVYIEVKATTRSDPSTPFLISKNELVLAAIHRDRYFIYRVTDALTDSPTVTRFRDPFGQLVDRKGELHLRNAQMYLTVAGDDNDEPINGADGA